MPEIQPQPVEPAPGPERRKRRLPAALAAIGIVILLVVVGTAAAELYYRQQVGNCVTAQAEQELGSNVSVQFGLRPLLLTRIDHRIPTVTADSDNARFGPAINMTVHARLNDIHLDETGRTATVGNSSAEAFWSNQAIAQTLHGLASDVTSSSETGIVSMTVLGGLANLELRPHIVDHAIQVDTVSSRGLPTTLVDDILELITQSLRTFPLDMQADSLGVTGTGIVVKLSGGHTTLHGDSDTCR